MRGMPDDPQLGVRRSLATRRAAGRCPCTGAAGRSTARPASARAQLGAAARRARGAGGEMRERAVRDHVHPLGVDAELVVSRARRAGSGRRPRRSGRTGAAGPRAVRRAARAGGFVRGEHERAPARQQQPVELLDGRATGSGRSPRRGRRGGSGACRGRARRASARAAPASRRDARGAAVEELAALVAPRRRHRPVGEAARDQLDVRSGARRARRTARGRRAACRRRGRRCGRASR